MLRRVSFVSAYLFFISLGIWGQTIQSVEVNGNNVFSTSQIIQWSEIGKGTKRYNGIIDSVKSRLAHNIGERGYLHSSFEGTKIVSSQDSGFVIFKLFIKEGEPTEINNFSITDNDSVSREKISSLFSYLQGQIFNKFEIEQNITDALTYFEDNGYPFAKILISSLDFYSDSTNKKYFVNIKLKVDKGINSKIDKIEIVGNTNTKNYVIIRELRLSKGEEYSQKLIEEIPKRLNRLRFFEPVSKPSFYINSKNEGILVIHVKEKQTNNFDGIIGYIPASNQNKKGYLTGLVNVSLRNLFGTGRAAAIKWQQYDRYSQNLELKYLEPWLFGYPFNLNLSLFQRKQDSTYVQRKLEGSLEYLATENISASLFVSSEAVIPTDNGTNIFTVYNSSSLTTGINIKIDTRDDPYAPTEGILFLNSYSFSKKKIKGPQQFITPQTQTNVNLQRITLDLSGFYELFSRQVVALGIHGRELRGSFLENSDLYRLGGTNTLRGYREDQFLGSRVFWSNLEYRLLLARRTYVFSFFDTGYYLRKADPEQNIAKQEGFKIGYGLGLDIETNLGVLGVSFALAKGDSFSNAKIHFGIVNEF